MSSLNAWAPRVLSLLRIGVGLLYLEHGTAKLFGFPHVAAYTHLPPLILAAGIIETVGSILLILGLFTRPAAFIMSGEMAVAYFMVFAPKSFFPVLNHGFGLILYCFIFFYIFVAGPGPWSLDAVLGLDRAAASKGIPTAPGPRRA
jgi:putative oxidoreductase